MPDANAASVGIDQTRRFMAGLQVVVPKIITRAKDGVGVDDILSLAGDATFKQAVENMIAAAKALPTEAKDLTFEEAAELTPSVVGLVIAVVQAVKAQPAA